MTIVGNPRYLCHNGKFNISDVIDIMMDSDGDSDDNIDGNIDDNELLTRMREDEINNDSQINSDDDDDDDDDNNVDEEQNHPRSQLVVWLL